MTNRLKENSISVENSKDLTNKSKLRTARPNIDHLIKRILNERRKEQKKNFLIFASIFLIISALMVEGADLKIKFCCKLFIFGLINFSACQ